jgi:hypothetical protein
LDDNSSGCKKQSQASKFKVASLQAQASASERKQDRLKMMHKLKLQNASEHVNKGIIKTNHNTIETATS